MNNKTRKKAIKGLAIFGLLGMLALGALSIRLIFSHPNPLATPKVHAMQQSTREQQMMEANLERQRQSQFAILNVMK